jgi:hypothetical protein
MTNTTNANREEQSYKPGWIDQFTNWVEKLPIRDWTFYVGLGSSLILCQMLVLWLDGGLQAEALLPVILFNALFIPFLLALIHLLDNQAVTALNSMRPTLEMIESEFEEFQSCDDDYSAIVRLNGPIRFLLSLSRAISI